MRDRRALLIVNAGSSSLKFSIFNISDSGELVLDLRGQIEGIGSARSRLIVQEGEDRHERSLSASEAGSPQTATASLAKAIAERSSTTEIIAVGHRIVHGGSRYSAPLCLDDEVIAYLETFNPLAPLHQPHNLAVVRAMAKALPGVPQVGCFDTAFHQEHDVVTELFALPYELYEAGVRRYGFHGLSYEYIAHALRSIAPAIAQRRVIVAHLGSGASLCALNVGRSIDSTMGFSALDGLPMGTRCGQLDPGVILYLLRERNMSVDDLESLFYKKSGLLGISGISSDMRDLLESHESRARLAVEYFVFHVAREIASLTATLGGIDALVFTAGIGERSAEIRSLIGARLAWLGITVDEAANRANAPCISASGAGISVWVIPTNEELMIARHTREVLKL